MLSWVLFLFEKEHYVPFLSHAKQFFTVPIHSSANTIQSFYLCYLTNYVSVPYLYTSFCCIAKVLKEYAYCIPNVIILITMGLEKYSLAFRKISSLTFCISLQAFEVDQILMSTHISKGQTSLMLSVLPDTVMRLLNGKIQNSFISGSGMNFYYITSLSHNK